MKKLEVITLDYSEFDKLVKEHIFKFKDFSVVALCEYNNDEYDLFTKITHEDNLPKYPKIYGDDTPNDYLKYSKPAIEKIISEKKYTTWQVSADDLLIYLCTLGVIEPGNYLLEISW